MKKIIIALFISLIIPYLSAETIISEKLIYKNGLYYKDLSEYPFTGKVLGSKEGEMVNGIRIGFWKYYLPNGKVYERGNYNQGEKDGIWEEFRYSGKLKIKSIFKNGELDGLYEKYYDNGQLFYTGSYKKNKLNGVWKSYDRQGNLKTITHWKNGYKIKTENNKN